MVRKLHDICILTIELNLKYITNIRKKLPGYLKELLLFRLSLHSHLNTSLQHYVTYNLFSDTLKHLDFSNCNQVTNNLFTLLTACECKLTSFSIDNSKGFSSDGLAGFLASQNELECLTIKRLHTLLQPDVFFEKIRSDKLRKLSLNYCDFFTDQLLISIASFCPGISKLQLERMKRITDAGIVGFVNKIHHGKLEILELRKMYTISSESIFSIAACSPNLETLYIPNCTKVSLESIFAILTSCPKLGVLYIPITASFISPTTDKILAATWNSVHTLNICGNDIHSASMLKFPLSFPNMKNFYFGGGSGIDNSTFDKLLSSFNQLTTLDCMYFMDADEETSSLIASHCQFLECLAIGAWRQSVDGLLPLFQDKRALKFTSIELTGCKNTSSKVLNSMIGNCKNLQYLYLRGVLAVDDQTVFDIANNLKQIKKISFRGCTHITLEESLIEMVLQCKMLVMIGVPGLRCVGDSLIHVMADNLFHLEELYVDGCNAISEKALEYLRIQTTCPLYIEHKLI